MGPIMIQMIELNKCNAPIEKKRKEKKGKERKRKGKKRKHRLILCRREI
jgi:hypothetical protein